MNPELIAQFIAAGLQLATQVIPLLSTEDQAVVAQAVAALNVQVDQLHQNAAAAVE